MAAISSVFETLGLSELEASVYSALLRHGPTSAGNLSKKVGIPRTTLYGMLTRLSEHGVIAEALDGKLKVFIAEQPEKITVILTRKLEAIEVARKNFREIIPALKRNSSPVGLRPRLEALEGSDGLQSVLKDMLLYYDLETFALWPITNMLEVLTPEFFRFLNKERIRNNLYTRAIWPYTHGIQFSKHPYLGVGEGFKREIRIAPREIEFPMGYWSYGTKTAFISSQRESFGFVIESAELVLTLRAQFDILWRISTPLVVDKRDTELFLKELNHY